MKIPFLCKGKKKKKEHKSGSWGNRPFALLDKTQQDIDVNPILKELDIAWRRGDFEPENKHREERD